MKLRVSVVFCMMTAYSAVGMASDIEIKNKNFAEHIRQQSLPYIESHIEYTKYLLSRLRPQNVDTERQHDLKNELRILKAEKDSYELTKKGITKYRYDENIDNCIIVSKQLRSLRGFLGIQQTDLDRLVSVNIANNALEYLPLYLFIEHCPQLQKLCASKNNIKLVTFRSDKEESYYSISESPWFTSLDISRNKLSEYDLDAQFQATPNLEYLNLAYNGGLASFKPNMDWRYITANGRLRMDFRGTGMRGSEIWMLRKWYAQNLVRTMSISLYDAFAPYANFSVCLLGIMSTIACRMSSAEYASNIALATGSTVAAMGASQYIGKKYVLPYLIIRRSLDEIESLVTERILYEDGIENR